MSIGFNVRNWSMLAAKGGNEALSLPLRLEQLADFRCGHAPNSRDAYHLADEPMSRVALSDG